MAQGLLLMAHGQGDLAMSQELRAMRNELSSMHKAPRTFEDFLKQAAGPRGCLQHFFVFSKIRFLCEGGLKPSFLVKVATSCFHFLE